MKQSSLLIKGCQSHCLYTSHKIEQPQWESKANQSVYDDLFVFSNHKCRKKLNSSVMNVNILLTQEQNKTITLIIVDWNIKVGREIASGKMGKFARQIKRQTDRVLPRKSSIYNKCFLPTI